MADHQESPSGEGLYPKLGFEGIQDGGEGDIVVPRVGFEGIEQEVFETGDKDTGSGQNGSAEDVRIELDETQPLHKQVEPILLVIGKY